jgi:hypothetical protein
MNRFLRKLSENLSASLKKVHRPGTPRRKSAFRPGLESLEERWCPAYTGPDAYYLAGIGTSSSNPIHVGSAIPGQAMGFTQTGLSINSATDTEYFQFTMQGTANASSRIGLYYTTNATSGDLYLDLMKLQSDGSYKYVDSGVPDNLTGAQKEIKLTGLDTGTYIFMVSEANGLPNDYTASVQINTSAGAAATNPFPVLNPVGQGGQIADVQPQITWAASKNASQYVVYLDDLTTGQTNLFPYAHTAGSETFWSPPSGLTSGHTYRVWVQGVGAFGIPTGPWSDAEDFTVSTVQFQPITGPVNDLYPNITWTGVQNATSYSVWVRDLTTGADNIYPNAIGGPNSWRLDPSNPNVYMTPGDQYEIWVKALNANGQGEWNAGEVFTIGGSTVAQPTQAIPDASPMLAVTLLGHSSQQVVWVRDLTGGADNIFPGQVLNGSTWTPPSPLTVGHTYRIWLKDFAPGSNTVGWWGPSTDITINTTISPVGTATTLRPTLTWDFVSNANSQGYDVWLEDQAAPGVNLAQGVSLPAATATWTPSFDLISGHTYNAWVRVQGHDWSAEQSFQIAKVTELKHIFWIFDGISFTALDGVDHYVLYVKDMTTGQEDMYPGLTAVQKNPGQSYGDTVVLPLSPPLVTGHQYRVFLKAVNSSGLGEWSDPFDFTK